MPVTAVTPENLLRCEYDAQSSMDARYWSSGDLICSIELEMNYDDPGSAFTARCLEEEEEVEEEDNEEKDEQKIVRVRWSEFKCPR